MGKNSVSPNLVPHQGRTQTRSGQAFDCMWDGSHTGTLPTRATRTDTARMSEAIHMMSWDNQIHVDHENTSHCTHTDMHTSTHIHDPQLFVFLSGSALGGQGPGGDNEVMGFGGSMVVWEA